MWSVVSLRTASPSTSPMACTICRGVPARSATGIILHAHPQHRPDFGLRPHLVVSQADRKAECGQFQGEIHVTAPCRTLLGLVRRTHRGPQVLHFVDRCSLRRPLGGTRPDNAETHADVAQIAPRHLEDAAILDSCPIVRMPDDEAAAAPAAHSFDQALVARGFESVTGGGDGR